LVLRLTDLRSAEARAQRFRERFALLARTAPISAKRSVFNEAPYWGNEGGTVAFPRRRRGPGLILR